MTRRYTYRCSYRRGWLGGAVLCLLLLMPAVYAQSEEVGSIEEIREGGERGEEVNEPAPGVLLTLSPTYTRKAAQRRAALHIREIVELREPYYVRASLRYGNARSQLFIGSTGARLDDVDLERSGAYEILPSGVDPLSGLELRIRHGVIVVEQAAGQLDAWMKGTLTSIFGTTVLFATDSTSADAFLFLRKGHIAFPNHGIEFRGQDAAWRLRDGVAPEPVQLDVAEWEQLREEVEFLSNDLWTVSRPFYQRPSFYIPAAVAVVGAGVAAAILLTGGDDEGGRIGGEVIIRIPH